jgi:hypothetical protein
MYKRNHHDSLRIPLALVLIIAGAFLARLIYWWFFIQTSHELSGDALFYYDAAHSIANTLTYSSSGMLTASKPPAYPVFAGLILKLFGDDKAVIFFQYLLGVLASLPIYWIVRNYLNENKALFVVAAYLIYPTTWFWESSFMSESLYVWLNNLFLFFMHRYMKKKNDLDLAAGSFWGAASFLTRASAIFPIGIVFLSIIFRNSFKKVLSITAIWCFIFLLVLSPWLIRNYIVFGKFIPASNSAGITLYTSYVSWGYDMSIVNILPEDRITWERIENEYEKNKFLLEKAYQFVKKNPIKMISLVPFKLKDYFHPFNGRWYPLSMGSKFNLLYGLLGCFAVLGFWWNRKTQVEITKLSLCFVIGAIISVIIFHGEIRYRFVLNPILFILAGLCFVDRLSAAKKKIVMAVVLLNMLVWGAGIAIQ